MKNYDCSLLNGIRPSPEFHKKGLAQYAVNVGLRCGHDCTYCSTRAMLRCHPAFKEHGRRASATDFSIIDPEMPEKVARDAKRIRRRGLVQLCTTVDAWAPEAQQLNLGRRCLEAILAEPGWTV
jgi:DNA repair photolyase